MDKEGRPLQLRYSAQRIVISGRYRLGSGYEIPVNLIKYVLHIAEPFFLAYIKNT